MISRITSSNEKVRGSIVLKHLTEHVEKTEKAINGLKVEGGLVKQNKNRVVPLIVKVCEHKLYYMFSLVYCNYFIE